MRALILLASYDDPEKGRIVENLYTGMDGVELEAAAEKAAESKKYIEIHRISNPSGSPMAIHPGRIICSTPTFPKRGQPVEIKLADNTELDKKQAEIRSVRESRFKNVPPPKSNKKDAADVKKTDETQSDKNENTDQKNC